MLKKAMVFMYPCVLFLLSASASFSNPDEGWKSTRVEINNAAIFKENNSTPSGESSIWNQEIQNPFENEIPLLRAKPGGDGTGQKEETLPIDKGLWIIMGLSIVYGLYLRYGKRDDSATN